MHRTTRATVLSAVAIATALGLVACGDEEPRSPAVIDTPPPITKPPTVEQTPESATVAPLPPPTALTDVLARVADANVPGAEKLDAVEAATPGDAEAMDKLGQALRDGGYAPLTFDAKDMTWADGREGNVLAVITIKTANPQAGDFTFPMEFRFADNHWQLTRKSADGLLALGEAAPPTPTP